jgi:hypothetical protein
MKIILSLLFFFLTTQCFADSPKVSPKPGWDEIQVQETTKPTILTQVLLWLPNRVADLIDIFRVDVGVGPAFGGVIRITEYAQAGYRDMSPMSFRLGDFGRDEYPWLLETDSEMGVSPFFHESAQRKVCSSEIGVGADLLIVGAYGGICLQEVADFIAGVFFLDLNDDDWE